MLSHPWHSVKFKPHCFWDMHSCALTDEARNSHEVLLPWQQVGGRLRSRIAEQLLNELEPDHHRTIVQLEQLQLEGRRNLTTWATTALASLKSDNLMQETLVVLCLFRPSTYGQWSMDKRFCHAWKKLEHPYFAWHRLQAFSAVQNLDPVWISKS